MATFWEGQGVTEIVTANPASRDPASGAPEGFAAFVAARYPALLATAWLLTSDRGKAEDLVQEALARAWVAWPRIRRQDRVEAYVRQTMANLTVSWWRRRWPTASWSCATASWLRRRRSQTKTRQPPPGRPGPQKNAPVQPAAPRKNTKLALNYREEAHALTWPLAITSIPRT